MYSADKKHRRNRAKNPQDTSSSLIHYAVVGFAFVAIAVLLASQTVAGHSDALQLNFNIFGLLSVVSLASNVIAFILIVRVKQRTETLMWFSVFLLSIMSWAVGEALTRFSATTSAALFWMPATTPGSVLMPVSLYMFVLSYTNSKHRLHVLTLSSLLGGALLLAYLDLHSELITLYDVTKFVHTPWGFVTIPGPAYIVITLWASLLPLAAVGQLYRFRRNAVDPVLRKQAQLFMFAIGIPLFGGAITDGLLPFLNVTIIPPLSVILLTIMGIVISFGILRYHFFSFTPSLIAEQILDTMNEAVIGVYANFSITYANAGAEQLLGMSASEIAKRHLPHFMYNQVSAAEMQEMVRTALGENDFGTIESVKLKSLAGTPTTAKLSITKLHDESQPYGYLIVITDITAISDASNIIERQVKERTRQLHAEQAKLRASIEGLALGFALIDDKGKVITQNEALSKMLNLHDPAITVHDIETVLSDSQLGKWCDVVRNKGRSSEIKEVGMGPKILHLFIAPVKVTEHGNVVIIGTVVLMQDVTEEKVLARSRDEFFSIASHELRTPLTSIKGNASMMIDYYKEMLDKDQSLREMVYDIHTSSGRLIEIVNDFLDVSKIEQGKMVFQSEAVALDKIIESIFYEMRTTVNEKKIDLITNTSTLGVLPKAWVDRDRMTQIIYNLVGNAVKFTDTGNVTVRAAVDDKYITVRVSDTGRGIPTQNQKLLFHKFQQAGTSLLTRDTTRGTGLGLYISKLMAERMGGDVKLESSEEGKGSVFVVTVPIANKKQLDEKASGAPGQGRIDVSTGLTK